MEAVFPLPAAFTRWNDNSGSAGRGDLLSSATSIRPAVQLEHQHEKFRPHAYQVRFALVAMRAVELRIFPQEEVQTSFLGC
jgi:hypothetical protein